MLLKLKNNSYNFIFEFDLINFCFFFLIKLLNCRNNLKIAIIMTNYCIFEMSRVVFTFYKERR